MQAAMQAMYKAVTKIQKMNKPQDKPIELSVIIVNWNVKEILTKCLESIFHYTNNVSYEVIVVDNKSSDGSVDHLEQKFRNQINSGALKLVKNDFNAGFAKANNQGYKLAQGEYILFMNPDMELVNNTFEKMLGYFKSKSGIGIATCRLLYGDKTPQPNVKSFPTFCSQFLILLKMHHFLSFLPCLKNYLMKDFKYTNELEVDMVMGAFIFTKKSVMEKIGAWDEDYWLWWEDVEMCRQVKDEGYRIMFAPITEVIHYEGKSFEQTFGLKKQKRFNKGMLLYFKKHHKKIEYYTLWLFQPISYLLTLITQLLKIKARPQSRV